MNCAICEPEMDTKPLYNYKDYKLYHCQSCDVMFWHPMRSPGREWYDAPFLIFGREFTWLKPIAITWAQRRFLDDAPARKGKLLDVGCGTGDFLLMAQDAGYSVTGIDISFKTIEIARSQRGLNEVYPYTIEELASQKPDEKYDVITFFELLEPLDNVPSFINSLKKLLKPNGFVALSVPNRDRWRFPIRLFLSFLEEWDYPPNHLSYWNIQALKNLFTSHGFSVLSVEAEPFKASDWAWNFLISQKLGIHPPVLKIAKKFFSKGDDSTIMPSKPGFRDNVVKLATSFYLRAFIPFLGMITLPLRVLLRKKGPGIYLLAQLKNQNTGG